MVDFLPEHSHVTLLQTIIYVWSVKKRSGCAFEADDTKEISKILHMHCSSVFRRVLINEDKCVLDETEQDFGHQ